MPQPTPEEYTAACLLERWAIGDEGDQREQSRLIILAGGPSAQNVADHARRELTSQAATLQRAIETLGLR